MTMDYTIRCEECQAYGGHHSVFCSKQTPEEVKAQLKQYYDCWLSGQQQAHEHYKKINRERTFLHGKLSMLKHENNKLRNKLRKAGIIK